MERLQFFDGISDEIIFEDKMINNVSITFENLSILIFNCTLLSTSITIKGKSNASVLIGNSTFNDSEISIDSMRNCKIKSCYFIPKAEDKNKVSSYMLQVWNTVSLNIFHTIFDGSIFRKSNNMIRQTQSVIKIHNISLAKVEHCTFKNIHSLNDGSILFITVSVVYIKHSQFISNMARYGVIYATNNIQITNENCSFASNSAEESGGVIHLTNNGMIKNMHSIFLQNYAGSRGGTLYLENSVQCVNFACSFQENSAKVAGAAIYTQNSVNVTNTQCNFTHNYGAVMIFLYANWVSVNQECIFVDNMERVMEFRRRSYGQTSLYKCTVSLDRCTFTDNRGHEDDDLFRGILAVYEAHEFVISNSSFIGNGGGGIRGVGGVMEFQSTHVTIIDSIFFNNSAFHRVVGKGGVMSLTALTSMTICNITRCRFMYNSGKGRNQKSR